MADLMIRPGRDGDADGFIALIAACWSQYPGVLLDVDGEMPELRRLASYYEGQGGLLWTAEEAGELVGMIAVRPLDDAAWEICRVYVRPCWHGGGLGHRLLDTAEQHAIGRGARRLRLWSDTRFLRAHRFYEKRSFVRSGPIRVLDDISHSLEFAYAKPVSGVEVLDAAAAASAEVRLAEITRAAGVGAVTMDGSEASARGATLPTGVWRERTRQVATGERVLLAGWADGTLGGVLSLRPGRAPKASHRAAISQVIVDPALRRQGMGRALMVAAEQEAVLKGRSLLTMMVEAGGPGEALCRSLGWHAAGVVPGYAMRSDERLDDAIIFWKHPGG